MAEEEEPRTALVFFKWPFFVKMNSQQADLFSQILVVWTVKTRLITLFRNNRFILDSDKVGYPKNQTRPKPDFQNPRDFSGYLNYKKEPSKLDFPVLRYYRDSENDSKNKMVNYSKW